MTSHFFPFDLHVHTPGSQDITVGNRYDALPSVHQQALPRGTAKDKGPPLGDYDKRATLLVPPQSFFELIDRQRTEVLTSLGWDRPESSLCLVGLTDHNVYGYSCEVATLAWEQFKQKWILILPGVELDVIFPIPGIPGKTRIHILCHFSPSKKGHDIHQAVTVANNNKNWSPGEEVEVADLAAFVNVLRNSEMHPAMCVAAHVSSASGIQAQVTRAVREFTQRDAATVAQVSAFEHVTLSPEKLQSIWADYPEPTRPETPLSLEHAALLSLLGKCGFDGLQVTCKDDQTHYRSLHRCGLDRGRSIPVIASDAHTPTDIFRCNGQVPFIKLPIALTTMTDPDRIFRIVRDDCIRFGETRTTFCPPERGSTWISGIEITNSASVSNASSFWPAYSPASDVNADGHCTLSFSRNLNCIIGGRGSGKSALIEALAFVTEPKTLEPSPSSTRGKSPSDSENRAAATPRGTTVRICWQSLHDPSFASLEKKAKFVTRYFDPSGHHSTMRVEQLDGTEIVGASGSLPPVHLFRFKDIELAAQPDHLRRMFDALHGNEVQILSEKIETDIRALKKQREEILVVAMEINELTSNLQSPLREYVRRKQQFDSVNNAAAKAEFEKIDKASALYRSGSTAVSAWEQIAPDMQLEHEAQEVGRFADSNRRKLLDKDGAVLPGAEDLAALLDRTAVSPIAELLSSLSKSKGQSEAMKQKLEDFTAIADKKLKTITDEASKKGVVVVTNAREVNRRGFEEATAKLEAYRELMEKMNEMMAARKILFDRVRTRCIERSRTRRETASKITDTLAGALDRNVLVIAAEAQERHDSTNFREWLSRCGGISYAREARIEKILAAKLLPDQLREGLLSWDGTFQGKLESVAGVRANESKILDDLMGALQLLRREKELVDISAEESLPPEITDGLLVFNVEASREKGFFNLVLELDEILIDDRPVILLNDRPTEAGSKLRPLEELSPGQRCSAILPILLATGEGPLIIDQPEDNLDTRLIRQVIVNILANIKLKRQVIMATHNPNIPVLGDAEQTLILRAIEDKRCSVDGYGDLGSKSVVHYITDIMEGGREAFQYRAEVYQPYWTTV